jgi:flavin-dependent dehydrogenase
MAPAFGHLHDVAIAGAGPAGASAARWLSRRGLSVLLVERSRFEAPRIGESLPPNVREPLCALGVWDRFLALGPIPSWETQSTWGEAEGHTLAHIVSPHGCGWHIDRRAFDAMLAESAAAAGSELRLGTAVRRVRWQGGRWSLELAAHRASHVETAQARLLIDATGRDARVARTLGAPRLLFDRLVGVATTFRNVARRGQLLVEAAPEGWWYSAPLPAGSHPGLGDAAIAMLMTDADVCARGALRQPERWAAALQSTEHTRRRLEGAERVALPRVHYAHSHRLLRAASEPPRGPWLAAGDAALSVDPASGSGIGRALRTGSAAAECAAAFFEQSGRSRDMLVAYDAERDRECTDYLVTRAHVYATERRHSTPFWARRQVLDGASLRPGAAPRLIAGRLDGTAAASREGTFLAGSGREALAPSH